MRAFPLLFSLSVGCAYVTDEEYKDRLAEASPGSIRTSQGILWEALEVKLEEVPWAAHSPKQAWPVGVPVDFKG